MQDMTLFSEAEEVLMNTIEIVGRLTPNEYTQELSVLSNGSIGAHTRHIIEHFQQLLSGYESAKIDYDSRQRNLKIERNVNDAVECMLNVAANLEKHNKVLHLKSSCSGEDTYIESNYHRELLFNMEHCIHHQAIIKIGLLQLGKDVQNENFGMAKSTIKHKKACVR
ncbi:MAG: DinB family protein [Bacteroidota bacterium]